MAKARKDYHKKAGWQWVIFYILVGGVIFTLLYYAGIINFSGFNNNVDSTREVEIYQ